MLQLCEAKSPPDLSIETVLFIHLGRHSHMVQLCEVGVGYVVLCFMWPSVVWNGYEGIISDGITGGTALMVLYSTTILSYPPSPTF